MSKQATARIEVAGGNVFRLPVKMRNKAAPRPYRLYYGEVRRFLPHKCYTYPKRAHEGAVHELMWLQKKPTATLQVIDVRTGYLCAEFKRERDNKISMTFKQSFKAIMRLEG